MGEISPEIIAVLVRFISDKSFVVEFYIYGAVTEALSESASCVETEVLADFFDDFDVSHSLTSIRSASEVLHADSVMVYLRKENENTIHLHP